MPSRPEPPDVSAASWPGELVARGKLVRCIEEHPFRSFLDEVVGLGRLLAVGLRVLSRVEFVVRRQLARSGNTLAGLYKGQPKQATARRTAERLPAQFEGATLTIITQTGQRLYHVTPLSDVQQRILALRGFPGTIYTKLAADSSQPP